MRDVLPEEQRLMLIQKLIDRLMYLEGDNREQFLNQINKLYAKYPIAQSVVWGAEAYQNQNQNENRESNLRDDD